MNQQPRKPDPLAPIDGLQFHRLDDEDALRLAEEELKCLAEEELESNHSSLDQNQDDSAVDINVIRRLRKLDQAIESALQSGPKAPVGFADRLKAAVAAQAEEKAEELGETVGEANVTPAGLDRERRLDDSQTSRRRSGNRKKILRRSMLGATALAAVASMLIVFVNWPTPAPPAIGRLEIARQAQRWRVEVQDKTWSAEPAPNLAQYPVNDDLLVSMNQWMTIETKFDSTTYVYNLTPPGGKQVLQFTARSSQGFKLPSFFPATPDYKTDQFCIGACYQEGVLYVVYVEGDANRYRQVLRELSQVV